MLSRSRVEALTKIGLPCLGLGFIAAFPVLFGEGVPRTNDLIPHLYRVYALDQMIQLGHLWPRWSAHLTHGFGYPVFNFFPGLAHWYIELFHLLGFTIPNAYRLTVLANYTTAALGAFFLGRELTGRWIGGWGLAAVYTLSPYLLYDQTVRGSPTESQALAILPWVMWGIVLLINRERPRRITIFGTAFLYACMILSHHGVTFQVSLLLGFWILLESKWMSSAAGRWRLGRLILVLGLGGALSAFFFLPALLEIDATRTRLTISQGYVYRDNFLQLADLLRFPVTPADPARINPPVVRPLHLVGLAAAILLIGGRWSDIHTQSRRTVMTLTGSLCVGVWLVTPAADIAWANLPILEFTLFPWRINAFLGLIVAMLVSIGLGATDSKWPGFVLTACLVAAAIPWLSPPREPMVDRITMADLSASEVFPFFIGTTTLGEYLPVEVVELPNSAAMREAIAVDPNVSRLLLPSGTAIQTETDPIRAEYQITTTDDQTVVYQQFNFPGWRVFIDGVEAPIRSSDPHGLIEFDLPAGDHVVAFRYGMTRFRTAGVMVSAIALFSLIGLTALSTGPRPDERLFEREVEYPTWRVVGGTVGVAILCFATLQTIETPLRRSTLQPDRILGLPQIEPKRFAGEVRLLSFEPVELAIAADESFELTLYVQPERNLGVDYIFGVQVLDERGIPYHASIDRTADWRFVAGDDPWPLDAYRLEPFEIELLPGTPPGEYRYLVGLVRRDTGETVATHEIGRLVVDRAGRGPYEPESGMETPDLKTDGMTLLGFKQDRITARPGEPLRLTQIWRVEDPDALPSQVVISAEAFDASLEIDRTYAWQTGDLMRLESVVRIPPGVVGGNLNLYTNGVELGQLTVEVPDRTFAEPEGLDIQVDAGFGAFTTLLGSSIEPCDDRPDVPCGVALVWRADQEFEVNHRVFVHLLNDSGEIVAQSDGEPAEWTRPTIGWLPPEIIMDSHRFSPPADFAGAWTIRVGMYSAETGERLQRPDGSDFVEFR